MNQFTYNHHCLIACPRVQVPTRQQVATSTVRCLLQRLLWIFCVHVCVYCHVSFAACWICDGWMQSFLFGSCCRRCRRLLCVCCWELVKQTRQEPAQVNTTYKCFQFRATPIARGFGIQLSFEQLAKPWQMGAYRFPSSAPNVDSISVQHQRASKNEFNFQHWITTIYG